MRWPLDLPSELAVGAITLRLYTGDDAPALFAALDGPQVWEHIPRAVPTQGADLDAEIRAKLADGNRVTFVVRRRDVVFAQGASWVQLRTDEHNGRSAAAIRKLPGVRELGLREDVRTRRDGSRRRSLLFRIANPAGP